MSGLLTTMTTNRKGFRAIAYLAYASRAGIASGSHKATVVDRIFSSLALLNYGLGRVGEKACTQAVAVCALRMLTDTLLPCKQLSLIATLKRL